MKAGNAGKSSLQTTSESDVEEGEYVAVDNVRPGSPTSGRRLIVLPETPLEEDNQPGKGSAVPKCQRCIAQTTGVKFIHDSFDNAFLSSPNGTVAWLHHVGK